MLLRRSFAGLTAALTATFAAIAFVVTAAQAQQQTQRWGRDYFPNVVLQDQDGRSLRFYDDLIEGKVVSINFEPA